MKDGGDRRERTKRVSEEERRRESREMRTCLLER